MQLLYIAISPKIYTAVWLQKRSVQCLCERVWPRRSFSIILCITAVEFSIQTDVCQVRMVSRQIYISTAPTKTHVGPPKKLNITFLLGEILVGSRWKQIWLL